MENKKEYAGKTKCPTCGAEDKITAHPTPIPFKPFDELIPVYTCQHCQTTWPCNYDKFLEIKESSNSLFNRKLLASGINTITVCKDGMDANYYNVEEQFEIAKQLVNPKISSLILLERFVKGVINKEIKPFSLTVVDINGQEYQGYIDEYGNLEEVYTGSIIGSKIFELNENLNIEIYKLKRKAYYKKLFHFLDKTEKESNAK